jgi:hypothetical protein
MILVCNNSGLGNRLKNIISALYIGENTKQYVLTDRCYKNFFKYCNYFKRDDRELQIYNTWSFEDFLPNFNDPLKKDCVIYIVHSKEVIFRAHNGLDFQYDNLLPETRNFIKKYWQRLTFTDDFLSYVNKFSVENRLSEAVGVHVRAWVDDPVRNALLFSIEDYTIEMDKYERDRLFFVSSDSEDVIKYLRSRYPSRILSNGDVFKERHISNQSNPFAMTNALLDLLMLSRCPTMIGTYQSTFTEAAWWLSEQDQNLIIPIPRYVMELHETN